MSMNAPPLHPPFSFGTPVRTAEDVQRIADIPLDQAMPVRSTYEIFRNSAHAFAERTALTFLPTADPDDPPVRWSYAQLLAGIHRTANALHALGVGPRDAVAVLLPGCLEYHLALWGGEAAGIVQPLNPLLSDDTLVSLMTTGQAKVLIAWGAADDADYWQKALRIRDRLPTLAAVLRVAPHTEAPNAEPDLPAGVFSFQRLLAAQPDDHLVSGRDIAPDDIAAYFHSGGTTGAPKLAMHSHRNQVFTAWANVHLTATSPHDINISGFPLFHVAGVLAGALASLSAGGQTVIPTTGLMRNREVVRNYWRLVEKHRATVLAAVPTMLAALANVPLDGADISSIGYCRTGAAVLPPELAARFERQFGLHVHESLGMTEMAGISTITPRGVIAPPGCVGFAVPHAQMCIRALDAAGGVGEDEVAPGETGMVLFKAPNVFPGFLDPADTAQAFTADGWLATGDLGWVDTEGRLHLSGRSKDLIIRSGHNIDPKAIEDALGAHPAVQMCAAVGAPDAYAGELPVVYATLRPGASATPEELLAFAAAGVHEAPARPRRVVLIDSMPVTNVGKIFKPELRRMAAEAVVRAIVDEVCAARGVAPAQRPTVRGNDSRSVKVWLQADTDPALHDALHGTLAPLPVQTRLVRG